MNELKPCQLDEARKVLWYCAQFTNNTHWAKQYRKALTDICNELDRRAAPENKPLTVTLPYKVGDTVFTNIDGHKEDYLDECVISRIEYSKDYTEPLFTAICAEKAEYQTYWQSDFGKIIFLEPYARKPEGSEKV